MSKLKNIFGGFAWNSPPWIKHLQSKASENPRRFWGVTLIVLAVLFTGWFGYHWYQSLPKPERVTAKITTPQLTPIESTLFPDRLVIDFGTLSGNELKARQVAPLSQIGQAVTKGVSISPRVEGEWRWESDSRLIFSPQTDWPADQTYSVKFDKDFFATGTKMDATQYAFTTLPFTATIAEFKFYQDPLNPHVRQAVATINFSFPVDSEKLADKVSLSWKALTRSSDNFKYTLTYDEHKRTAYIRSESLPLPETERFLQLTLQKGIKAETGSATTAVEQTKSILVPDANSYFKVTNLSTSIVRNEKDQPEQVITLETSIGTTEATLNKSLHAYVLPKDYPATSAEEAKPNYQWKDPGEITPAILALATPLSLQTIPSERDYATLHSYKYYADTPSYIYVTVDKGIKGFGGFALANSYNTVLSVPAYPQEISFMHKGALLALGSEEKLSVLVRGLKAVNFEVARVLPGDVNHLITQTNGEFSNPYFLGTTFNQQNISQIFSFINTFDATNAAKAQYTALDLGTLLAKHAENGPRGLFLLQAHGWDLNTKSNTDVQTSRLVLITDLGLIVKDNVDGTHDVFAQSITRGTPVANANVSLLGKNGVAVLTRKTDFQGRANFPSLSDYINEREPTVYLAQNGSDVSFIPFSHYDRRLNFSRYDIGGVTSNNTDNQSALSAYVFTDRGIYRPGDTAHIAMIVKQPYVMPQGAGLPLEATVVDPRGVVVKDEKMTLNDSGYLNIDFQPANTAPTGQYLVNLYIVKDGRASSLIGSTTLKVGEFLPDRMRISAHLSNDTAAGWVSPMALTAKVGLWNLYGAPAANHRISAKVLLTPQAISFKQFPDYTFIDPLLNPKSPPKIFTDNLKDVQTNAEGLAQLNLNLERFEKATYQLTVFAEGFEAEGGRSVTTQVKALVSPLPYLVGYKTDGDLNYIKQNATRSVHFIAINPQLKQINVDSLNLQIAKLQPVTTLVKKDDGTYHYQSIIQTTQLSKTSFAIHANGDNFTLPADQLGDFLVTITDQSGTELSTLKYSIVGDSKLPLPKNAELNIKLDKSVFNAGDEIEMQITAPYTGAGLITIERDKVYTSQWFKADTTSSIQKIKIPSDFQGDGYVNIAFVRDFNSPDIFMSPLSYSVAPFSVTHANHAIKVDLSLPPMVLPGTPLLIKYKTDKPSKIIVFAVDEGILQVTKFETPDPLQYFFRKHALEVETQQIVDQILPKFVASRELSSVGGDGGEEALSSNLNPFKRKTEAPVVFWSGVIDSDGTEQQLTYNVPDYFNGSLRVMAVAVAAEAVGSASQSTEVRGHFVINPNVPTFVAPNDEFDVNASIANNVEGSGAQASVTVTLDTGAQLKLEGDNKQIINIPEGQERSVHFKAKASEMLGSADLLFTASLNDKTSKITSTLSVRPAVAFTTNIESGYATDATKALAILQTFYPEYHKAEIAVSRSPLILVTGLKQYLNDYPYGCVEQLVSKAFPWLVMANQPWFNKEHIDINDKIQKTIDMLSQRQMASGAFNYWPDVGTTESNDFASVYAMHFLTEAKAHGFTVPSGVFSAGIGFLKDLATQDIRSGEQDMLERARLQAYAIYILTRNEIVTTNYLTNLQLTLEQNKKLDWHQDIISVYIASTYQLLKNQSEAEKMIGYYKPLSYGVDANRINESDDFYNGAIANAQYIYLIGKHFPDKLASVDTRLMTGLADALNSNNISTVLAGYASLALSHYDQTQSSEPISISADHSVLSASSDQYQFAAIKLDTKAIKLNNPSKTGYFYQLSQAGFDKAISATNHGIEVYREYKNAGGASISETNLGDEIIVQIRARTSDNQYQSNVAIVDLLPGGFEVVNDSIKASSIDYFDVREDRIIFFANLNSASIEINYKLKATAIGKFVAPPIFAAAMYNPMVKSVGVTGKMTVTQP